MERIIIKCFVCNPYEQNSYVLHRVGKTGCVIIDAGMYSTEEQQALYDYICREHLTVEAILITHGHSDHICGLPWLRGAYPDADVYTFDTWQNTPHTTDTPATLRFTFTEVQVLATPGHKEDCLCFLLPAEGILFSGDTLFNGSVGRTDLSGGNWNVLMQSLQTLMQLPPDTTVYPGHGEPTTIAHEKQYNPFITRA